MKRPKKQKGGTPVSMAQQMPLQQQQHHQQMQQNNQMHMQMNMQVNCEDCTNEEMFIEDASDPQSQMNPNMQQFQSNQINPNQMMNQNMPGGMGGVMNAQGQQSVMGFVQGGPGGQQPTQQQWAAQGGGFNPMQQQQQSQQFYNQGMQPQSKFFSEMIFRVL